VSDLYGTSKTLQDKPRALKFREENVLVVAFAFFACCLAVSVPLFPIPWPFLNSKEPQSQWNMDRLQAS
jgi:hypothetical protein